MKNYQNGMYDSLIETRVRAMKFQNEFKPFVIDILKRRAYQYDFTHKQVTLDLDRLTNSLQHISTKKDAKDIGGVYHRNEKSINLNYHVIHDNDATQIYQILAHELYHALAVENGEDTMGGLNPYSRNYNCSLLEVLVEEASYRTIFPVKTSNPYYNFNGYGYRKMGFASDMLCATFGINKQELLQNSIQGREGLIKFLSAKSRCDYENIDDFLNIFEMSLAVIHNSHYRKYNEKKKQPTDWDNMAEAIGRMKRMCADMMLSILENTPEEELSKEKFEDLKFNFNKLNKVIQLGTKHCTKNKKKFHKTINDISGSFMSDYANSLQQTEFLMEFQKTHPLQDGFGLFKELARKGRLEKYDNIVNNGGLNATTLSDLGIVLPQKISADVLFKVPSETIKRNQEHGEKIDEWDNRIVKGGKLKRVLRKTRMQEIWSTIKSNITGNKMLGTARLEPTTQEVNTELNQERKLNSLRIQQKNKISVQKQVARPPKKSKNKENNDYDER